jgi:LAS superfamily LD-carboxypeptidase LdcB
LFSPEIDNIFSSIFWKGYDYMLKIFKIIGIIFIVLFCLMTFFSRTFTANEQMQMGELKVVEDISTDSFEFVTKSKADIMQGDLILVNNETPYHFTFENELVSLYDVKNSAYKVKDKDVLISPYIIDSLNGMLNKYYEKYNDNTVTVISGYRTYEKQQSLYEQRISESGEAEAMKWVAKPGGSEHHTGYAFDFGLYTKNGRSLEYNGKGKCDWINKNAYKYGFIVRYPGNKSNITGILYEPWHFRYVGNPHSTIISQYNMCMEEYIDYLRQFEFGKKHLEFTDYNGKHYEIFYTASMNVPVPKNGNYRVSGNNIDGFIVTIEK